MPIEFNCPSCGQMLRVPDEAAGKQAKCPSCEQIASIPNPNLKRISTDDFGFEPLVVGSIGCWVRI